MRLARLAALACAALTALPAQAEFEASLDLRLLDSNGRMTFLDGGLGKLRFDSTDDGFQLGRLRLAWRESIGGNWHANIDLSAWSVDDHNFIDVTEAWVEWRPVPQSAWRSNVKIGAFFPPVSLEHRAPGWSNPYTLASSALNTWVGEELRTIGVGYELEHLGQQQGSAFDYGFNFAVYGWNDPAGVIVGHRGFAMHDRQTPLFGRIGTYINGGPTQRVVFAEIDDRPGWQAGTYVRHDTGIELRALHYDNRGEPEAYSPSVSDFAWRTRFDSVGLRYDGPHGTTLIVQWLGGDTAAGPESVYYWDFQAAFGLVAQEVGPVRFAFRYDDFHTYQRSSPFTGPLGVERGDALTFNATWAVHDHVELIAEWMEVRSWFNGRYALGEDPRAHERILQLALRLTL